MNISGFVLIAVLAVQANSVIPISTFEDLVKIGKDPAYPFDGHYELTNDIAAPDSIRLMNDGRGFEPVGGVITIATRPITLFAGKFDGKGFTISGIYINRPDNHPIGFFAYLDSNSYIANLNIVADSIIGGDIVGGLAGSTGGGTIRNCSFTGNVIGGNERIDRASYIGGLVGWSSTSTDDGPYKGITIYQSYSAGTVTGTKERSSRVGGLVGSADSRDTILESYSSSEVRVKRGESSWEQCAGGLVGGNSGLILRSYATGRVEGELCVGGLVGSGGVISESYATGDVKGRRSVGGLVGVGGPIYKSYATGNVEGDVYVGGLIGGNESGNVIVSDCYATGNVKGGSFAGGLIGAGGGTGSKISNCYATGRVDGLDQVGGLVGSTSGRIFQSYATGNVSGETSVGGLVGRSSRDSHEIEQCYASGNVTGISRVGGLIGSASSGKTIQCYATGNVIGTGIGGIGGLIGFIDRNGQTVQQCYASGTVIGGNNIGGLVGIYEYTGSTTYITQSYWNATESGTVSAGGGIGRTTAQLKQKLTFDGWDFNTIWQIDEGNGYPYLLALGNTATSVIGNGNNITRNTTVAYTPLVSVRGKTLNIKSASPNSELQIRLFDMRGKTLARFNTKGSNSFSLSKIPAGRYLAETRENGKMIAATAIVLK